MDTPEETLPADGCRRADYEASTGGRDGASRQPAGRYLGASANGPKSDDAPPPGRDGVSTEVLLRDSAGGGCETLAQLFRGEDLHMLAPAQRPAFDLCEVGQVEG